MSTTTKATTRGNDLETTLQQRIDETRRLVHKIDVTMAFLTLATIVFGGLILAVLADHWLFRDGLSNPMRLGFFLVLLAVAGFYVYRKIVPLFLYSINPVYAASILEQSSPSAKNALVNWLLLRRERTRQEKSVSRLTERILDGVTRTAASSVSEIPTEKAVDLRGVVHWGIALALLLLFFVAYCVFSPKNPLSSMARIMLPLSGIEAPQAIQFRDIQPGNTTALQGEKITVSAELIGRSNDPVYLYFTSDDGQAVRQAVPMRLPEGKIRYETPFPPGKQGFVSSLEYWIQQGESRSGTFRIDVHETASLEIASLTYVYPPYTGLPDETVEGDGDIRAVEGTEVKINLRSTLPLQRAELLLDNDSSKAVGMRVYGDRRDRAAATIALQLDPCGTTPTTTRSFSFRATDENGYESRRSGTFRMEVVPDKPPIVQWSDTDEKLKDLAQIDLPLNGKLELAIQAEDVDFALRYLRFQVESGNKSIRPVDLIRSPATGPTEHKGSIEVKTVFSPIESRLAEGDTAEIWAEAIDTKFPDPNSAATRRIKIIVGPRRNQEQQEPQPKQGNQDRDDKQQNDRQPDKENNEQKGDSDEKQAGTDDTEERTEGESEASKSDSPEGEAGRDERRETSDDAGNEEKQPSEGREENEGKQDPDGGGKSEPGENESANDQKGDRNDGESDRQNGGQDENSSEESPEGPSGDKRSTENKEDKAKQDGSRQENGGDKNDSSRQQESSADGSKEETGQENRGDNRQEKEAGRQQKSIDPETNPGDAIEEIMKQMKEDGKLPPEDELNSPKNDQGTPDQSKKQSEEGKRQDDQQNKQEGKDSQQQKQEPGQQQKQDPPSECPDCDGTDPRCPSCSGGNQQDGGQQNEGEKQDKPENQGTGGGGQEQQGGDSQQDGSSGQSDSREGSKDGSASKPSGSESQDGAASDGRKTENQSKQDPSSGGDSASSDKSPGQQDGGGHSGGGKDSSPGKQNGDTTGGDQSGDPNSDPERRSGDNRNSDGQDIPVDPNDANPRQRGDLDPNTQDRRSQGQDFTEPKESNQQAKDAPQNTMSSGDEGKGQETRQQGQSDRAQSAEQGRQGDRGQDGVQREGGSDTTGDQQEGEGGDGRRRESPDGDQSEQVREGQGESSEQAQPGQAPENGGQQGEPEGSHQGSSGRNPTTPSAQQTPSGQPEQNGDQAQPGGSRPGGGGPPSAPSIADAETRRDDPNYEYTNKVTNLVLEYLEDQLKNRPNPELLEKLGWNEDQLRAFHQKWKEMAETSRQAQTEGSDSDDWKEALKSLGIKPARDRQDLKRSTSEFKDGGSSIESGRYDPPPGLRKRAGDYNERIGAGGAKP